MVDKASFLSVADEDVFEFAGGNSPHFLQTENVEVMKHVHKHVSDALVLIASLVGTFRHRRDELRVEAHKLDFVVVSFLVRKHNLFCFSWFAPFDNLFNKLSVKRVHLGFDFVLHCKLCGQCEHF